MDNFKKVDRVFSSIAIETYYALNMKLCLLKLSKKEIEIIETFLTDCEKERNKNE